MFIFPKYGYKHVKTTQVVNKQQCPAVYLQKEKSLLPYNNHISRYPTVSNDYQNDAES